MLINRSDDIDILKFIFSSNQQMHRILYKIVDCRFKRLKTSIFIRNETSDNLHRKDGAQGQIELFFLYK